MPRSLVYLATLALASASCDNQPATFTRAAMIEDLSQAIGGPKASAQPGDYILENEHFRVAILSAARSEGDLRTSMGPGLWGGSLVDADLQRTGARYTAGRGVDQFAEMFPTISMNVPAPTLPEDVSIISDGSDGGPAIIRVESKAAPFLTMLAALWALTRVPDMRMVTDYIAEPGVKWLTMRTAVRVGKSSNLTRFDGFPEGEDVVSHTESYPLIDRAVIDGLIVGDFFLSGGSLSVFAPGMGFDEDGEVARAGERGENTFASPLQYAWISAIGDGVSYGIIPKDGDAFVPLFTSAQTAVIGGSAVGDGEEQRFEDGRTFIYERAFFIGHGDPGSIYDQVLEYRNEPYGVIRGQVTEEGTGDPLSEIDVFVFEPGAEYPVNMWRTDVQLDDNVPDGSYGGRMPPGEWELLVHREGRPDPERLQVTVVEGEAIDVPLMSPRPGVVSFTLVDQTGEPLPAKVSFFRTNGDSAMRPELGDGFISGSPDAVVFPMYGEGRVELPDGQYIAVASRGMEYEIDQVGPFTIDGARSHHVDFQLDRSVVTDGWVSADFHVHASPSFDSGVALDTRVASMVCEGVEFFSSNDHDVITDYAPTVEALNMERWVQTAVGVETSTVELGHFLAFPLQGDFVQESGGAMDWTGMAPYQIFSSLELQGDAGGFEPLIFVGHPRAGILGYFDQYGFSAYGGRPGIAGEPGQPSVQTPILGFTNPLLNSDNLELSIDAMEIAGTKELFRIRTPTQAELDGHAEYLKTGEGEVPMASILKRTAQEQQDLFDGTYTLGYGINGQVDDWFTLLNLGFRITALANSDTHSLHTTEAGCPRNYVMSNTDEPALIDDQDMANAVKHHRVVASYGPFVQMWLDDAQIGDELVSDAGAHTITVDVQAPSWMDVDQVELYENGTLIHVWQIDGRDPQRFTGQHGVNPTKDSWYVTAVVGDETMAPVFTPVERPIIDLQAVVVDSLSGVEAVSNFLSPSIPYPQTFPIVPYAITNPIWLDQAGDGFDAPGVPEWLEEPQEPAEAR
ncbi:MAG: hypothetical protein ACI9MC_000795 [Kiritimatiellia bacterium]|jgi:hypothetical protein